MASIRLPPATAQEHGLPTLLHGLRFVGRAGDGVHFAGLRVVRRRRSIRRRDERSNIRRAWARLHRLDRGGNELRPRWVLFLVYGRFDAGLYFDLPGARCVAADEREANQRHGTNGTGYWRERRLLSDGTRHHAYGQIDLSSGLVNVATLAANSITSSVIATDAIGNLQVADGFITQSATSSTLTSFRQHRQRILGADALASDAVHDDHPARTPTGGRCRRRWPPSLLVGSVAGRPMSSATLAVASALCRASALLSRIFGATPRDS